MGSSNNQAFCISPRIWDITHIDFFFSFTLVLVISSSALPGTG